MIFVTVGTHEQGFERLIKKVDDLVKDGKIKEDVVMQIGFTQYKPKYCKWQKLFPYSEMKEMVQKARIVITHGGPASFIMVLQEGKTPIVVPRMAKYNEHVNDHQVDFSLAVNERYKNLIVVEDIENLGSIISDYNNLVKNMNSGTLSNNAVFNKKFKKIVDGLF
ncbi:glycosyltransferase [Ligilactobacillus salivarius]|uniref:glycosyltransferase n=1 Tax=Ligilactobacillus salivarius TaxID=1624 RepID=UPI0009DB0ECD|nr:glycosyltransferase [Ligilactobacillus salivarius]OQQ79456.1 multidrug MFS transporter [Ligilactobacillus salivarius]OUN61666.1 multidrug MFS transporter [Ligilactobacillus salivarius]